MEIKQRIQLPLSLLKLVHSSVQAPSDQNLKNLNEIWSLVWNNYQRDSAEEHSNEKCFAESVPIPQTGQGLVLSP